MPEAQNAYREHVGGIPEIAGIAGVGGVGANIPYDQPLAPPQVNNPTLPLDHHRRREILQAIQEISAIMQTYKIEGPERCLVGRLCQTIFGMTY